MQLFPIIVLILSGSCSQSIGSSNRTRTDQVAPSRSKRSPTAAILETGPTLNPAVRIRTQAPIKHCSELRSTDQAVIQPPGDYPPFWGLCVQRHKETGGGWLVIQQRRFARLSFARGWIEYREGFGILDGEFWLGLENIFRLTSQERYEMLADMAHADGPAKYARYSHFEIASEEENYALIQLGSYSGTAEDSLRSHLGMAFSTFDNDHDTGPLNCALNRQSGWWFNHCATGANLNGDVFNWYGFNRSWVSLHYARMMLRRTN